MRKHGWQLPYYPGGGSSSRLDQSLCSSPMEIIARVSRRALTSFSSLAQPSVFHRTFSAEAAKVSATTPSSDRVKWDYRG
ncbi:hypothetical protein ACFX2I_037521 [Malus domestica]